MNSYIFIIISTFAIAFLADIDRSAIRVGDMIDAFCSKTVQWYDSRVLASKPSPEGELIKVVLYSHTLFSLYPVSKCLNL